MRTDTKRSTDIEAEIITENTTAPVLKDIQYPVTVVHLQDLLSQYEDIPNINPESENAKDEYDLVLKGHKAFVKARSSIEKARKKLKAPSIEYGKNVDQIAKNYQGLINPTENLLAEQREKFENHEKIKRARLEQQEQDRKDEIKGRIDTLKNLSMYHIRSASSVLEEVIASIEIPNEDDFQEYTDEAIEVYKVSMSNLEEMHETKLKAEQADSIEKERLSRLEAEEAIRLENIERERAELEAEKEAFRVAQAEQMETMRLMQESIDLQKAEKEAEELQKRQDEEEKQRLQQAEENHARCYQETLDDLSGLKTLDAKNILDAIIEGNIKNLSWEVN